VEILKPLYESYLDEFIKLEKNEEKKEKYLELLQEFHKEMERVI
jgi:hypothetical protein